MTRLFVRHEVADYAKWRKAYDDFNEEFGTAVPNPLKK